MTMSPSVAVTCCFRLPGQQARLSLVWNTVESFIHFKAFARCAL